MAPEAPGRIDGWVCAPSQDQPPHYHPVQTTTSRACPLRLHIHIRNAQPGGGRAPIAAQVTGQHQEDQDGNR